MLACSDIMPGDYYRDAAGKYRLERSRKQTYGSVARCLLDELHALTA
jgi:hypothetical protein